MVLACSPNSNVIATDNLEKPFNNSTRTQTLPHVCYRRKRKPRNITLPSDLAPLPSLSCHKLHFLTTNLQCNRCLLQILEEPKRRAKDRFIEHGRSVDKTIFLNPNPPMLLNIIFPILIIVTLTCS